MGIKFELNDKLYPTATGFYELRPYYQKLNVLDEKEFAIQYCPYEKQWVLIKDPFGDAFSEKLDLEPKIVAKIFQGESFSNSSGDIYAFNTFKDMHSHVIELGKQHEQLKINIQKLEAEIRDLVPTIK